MLWDKSICISSLFGKIMFELNNKFSGKLFSEYLVTELSFPKYFNINSPKSTHKWEYGKFVNISVGLIFYGFF